MKNFINIFKNKKYAKFIYLALTIILVIGGFFIYEKRTQRVFIEDSLVDAPVISLVSEVPGRLNSVDVTEGQNVNKGDTLATVGSNIVRAYTSGKVVSTNKQLGGIVSAQTPVVQMVDTSNMRINGTLDENKGLNKVKVGQPVSFTVDAFPGKTYWGYVDEVSETAKSTSATFSISSTRPTQQFNVYARFNTADYPEIKNGMSAKMTVYTR